MSHLSWSSSSSSWRTDPPRPTPCYNTHVITPMLPIRQRRRSSSSPCLAGEGATAIRPRGKGWTNFCQRSCRAAATRLPSSRQCSRLKRAGLLYGSAADPLARKLLLGRLHRTIRAHKYVYRLQHCTVSFFNFLDLCFEKSCICFQNELYLFSSRVVSVSKRNCTLQWLQ